MSEENLQLDPIEEVHQFRYFHQSPNDVVIPETPENRIPTDRGFWIAYVVFFVIFIPFAVYTLTHFEPKSMRGGADDCGNFCGFLNKKYDQWECSGQDFTEKPYLIVFENVDSPTGETRICVSDCPGDYAKVFNECLPEDEAASPFNSAHFMTLLRQVGLDVVKGWWAIVVSTIINLLLCIGTLYLFRYAAKCLVWTIIVGGIVFLFGLALLFFSIDQAGAGIFLFVIAFVILVLVVLWQRRVVMIIQMFKESAKTIADMPCLVSFAVWGGLTSTLFLFIFIVLMLGFVFSVKQVEVAPGYLDYEKDDVMNITIAYSFLVLIWTLKIIAGAQYMVIAGAVAAWFFTRNKRDLGTPLITSFLNFWKFHKGTVTLGSLILMFMDLVRGIVKNLMRKRRVRKIFKFLFGNIEYVLQYLSKQAYIQTAMHGQPFFKSAKRAAKLLMTNAANLITLIFIGDLVLGVLQFVLLAVCLCVSLIMGMVSNTSETWLISAIIAFCLVVAFFAVLKATIECIFVCFCEDTKLNDGTSRPYFMSKELMQFIEKSKYTLEETPWYA